MAWLGMAWHGMAWHGMAWHGMAWHGMAWCLTLACMIVHARRCVSSYLLHPRSKAVFPQKAQLRAAPLAANLRCSTSRGAAEQRDPVRSHSIQYDLGMDEVTSLT